MEGFFPFWPCHRSASLSCGEDLSVPVTTSGSAEARPAGSLAGLGVKPRGAWTPGLGEPSVLRSQPAGLGRDRVHAAYSQTLRPSLHQAGLCHRPSAGLLATSLGICKDRIGIACAPRPV